MRTLYDKVYEYIRKVDFLSIWPGFKAYHFALYNDESVYLYDKTIDYDENFMGNTSICFESEHIAIWKVENPEKEDPLLLACNMVHEMFHAYQHEVQEQRFPDDLSALDYPVSNQNAILKHSEYTTLCSCIKSNDKSFKLDCIKSIVASRMQRKLLIGDFIHYEYKIETVEGMAEYAGLKALHQSDKTKYDEKIEGYMDKLRSTDMFLFDTRRISYISGALLMIVLVDADIDIFHDMSKEKKSVFELACFDVEPGILPRLINLEKINESYNLYIEHKKSLFDDFFSKNNTSVQSDFTIVGYDPMNMIKLDDMILCKHFIMLKSIGSSEPVIIKGPVIVKTDRRDIYNVISYYQSEI